MPTTHDDSPFMLGSLPTTCLRLPSPMLPPAKRTLFLRQT
jgi:hypothetical protein